MISLAAAALLFLCLVCMSKLMGIEMILVFQMTYAGLLMVTKQEALMAPLR